MTHGKDKINMLIKIKMLSSSNSGCKQYLELLLEIFVFIITSLLLWWHHLPSQNFLSECWSIQSFILQCVNIHELWLSSLSDLWSLPLLRHPEAFNRITHYLKPMIYLCNTYWLETYLLSSCQSPFLAMANLPQ